MKRKSIDDISDQATNGSQVDYQSQGDNSQNGQPSDNIKDFKHNRFDDMFDIDSEIGYGGNGKVVSVQDNLTQQIFAVKIISLDKRLSVKSKREVKTMLLTQSPYVVKYVDSWTQNRKCLFIQMELLSTNLETIIEEKRKCFGRKMCERMTSLVEYFISCQLFKELLECVQYLHESESAIIHRDLKPANVLIDDRGRDNRFLKICDFGIAKTGGKHTRTHTMEQGTARYMAPEVQNGTKYTYKADIYSLGRIVEELFDMYINSHIPRNPKQLLPKWKILKELIIKMVYPTYRDRPDCRDILAKYKSWGIDFNAWQLFQMSSEDTTCLSSSNYLKNYFEQKSQDLSPENESSKNQPKITEFFPSKKCVNSIDQESNGQVSNTIINELKKL